MALSGLISDYQEVRERFIMRDMKIQFALLTTATELFSEGIAQYEVNQPEQTLEFIDDQIRLHQAIMDEDENKESGTAEGMFLEEVDSRLLGIVQSRMGAVLFKAPFSLMTNDIWISLSQSSFTVQKHGDGIAVWVPIWAIALMKQFDIHKRSRFQKKWKVTRVFTPVGGNTL